MIQTRVTRESVDLLDEFLGMQSKIVSESEEGSTRESGKESESGIEIKQESSKNQERKNTLEITHTPTTLIILICAHAKRDKRCGILSDILLAEFEKVLFDLNLQDKVRVYGCSHVGGHKYAGNVLVWPQGDVYGRVTACHVRALVEECVLGKKVLKELWRGRVES